MRRILPGLVVVTLVAPLVAAHETTAIHDRPGREPISQATLGDDACGVVALVNALQLGDADCRKALAALDGKTLLQKADHISKTHAARPSRDYGVGTRQRDDGVSCVDLTDITKEVLAPAKLEARGAFLDRAEDESDHTYLRRVHQTLADALKAERPPVVSIRSFAVAKDDKFDSGFSWNGVSGHYITVVSVPAELPDKALGFTFDFIDPADGERASGYVHVERNRAFLAAKGNREKWEWKRGSPFLLVTLPTQPLRTDDQPWWSRTIITLNYAITFCDPRKEPAEDRAGRP